MLAAADIPTPALALGPGVTMPRHALFVVGEGTTPPQFNLLGPDALVVIGDRVTLPGTAMSVGDRSTILIGDDTRCTLLVLADIRNGGALIVGRDCLLTSGTSFLSDDTHAIRDLASGRRLNKRGGRILVEDHVLVSDRVRIMGDAWIGRGSVVAATAFVKDARFAPGTLAGGRPARVVETGIRWSADDPG